MSTLPKSQVKKNVITAYEMSCGGTCERLSRNGLSAYQWTTNSLGS
jgi:hypothetical protein